MKSNCKISLLHLEHTLMIFEAGNEEQRCAQKEDHHGGRSLVLARGETSADNDLMKSLQLASQSFVLRFQLLNTLVQLIVFFRALSHTIFHAIEVFLLALPRILGTDFISDFTTNSDEI